MSRFFHWRLSALLMFVVSGVFFFASVGAPALIYAAGGATPVGKRPSDLKKDAPFKVTAEAIKKGDGGLIRVSIWMFKDDHYLYEEATSVQIEPPAGVKVGEAHKPPSKTKYDENFEEDKVIYKGTPTFEVPLSFEAGLSGTLTIPVTVKLRGCNPTQCFFPQTESLSLILDLSGASKSGANLIPASTGKIDPPEAAKVEKKSVRAATLAGEPSVSSSSAASSLSVDSDISEVAKESLFLALLVAFGAGLLTSLTPCVYPVIPITLRVLGASNANSKLQAFSLAFVYVLGMALVYTILGVVAASSGGYLGEWLQSKALMWTLVVIFVAMGFSMLGAFDLALPSAITNKLQDVEGTGYPGAFLAGTISGVVVGPCSAPVLLSLLAYIAQTGNIVVGSILMFTYAMGLGVLFLFLGTFAASVSTPRSGPWMDAVKGVLALMIFGVALFYMRLLVPEGVHAILLGAFAIVTGVFVGAFHPISWDDLWQRKARKSLGILAVIVGVFFSLDGLMITRGFHLPGAQAVQAQTASIAWVGSEEDGLKSALAAGKPALIDFGADWCAVCQEIEHEVFSDASIQKKMKGVVGIKLDCTNDDDPQVKALMKKYGVLALPKIVFVNKKGEVREDLAVTSLVTVDAFSERLAAIL